MVADLVLPVEALPAKNIYNNNLGQATSNSSLEQNQLWSFTQWITKQAEKSPKQSQ